MYVYIYICVCVCVCVCVVHALLQGVLICELYFHLHV